MRFSVIVPAYNVQDYIVSCIDSILKQSFRDYEIILVNDGSTDATFEHCQELCRKNTCIKLVNKENGGLSSARNAGINKAEGDYLLFLDGDDFWRDDDFLENLNCIIETHSPDTIIFPYSYYYGKDRTKEYQFDLSEISSSSNNFSDNLYSLIDNGIWYPSACNKCIRRDIVAINNILFPLNMTSEDVRWCFELSQHIASYYIYNQGVYMYRQNREGSISYKLKMKNLEDLFLNIENVLSGSKKIRDADYLYLSHYYLEVIPYVMPFLKNPDVKRMLSKYKWLSKYSKNTRNSKKRVIYFCLTYMGFRLSSLLLSILVKLYKLI